MAKKQMYVVGVITKCGSKLGIKYVTSLAEHNWARWEPGKDAMEFNKDYAISMCKGFAWNGISATPILKLDWLDYYNPEEEENETDN